MQQSEQIERLLHLLPTCSPTTQAAILEKLRTEKLNRTGATGHAIPGHNVPWRQWLVSRFPHVAYHEPTEFHERYWDWVQALRPGASPTPFVGCVFRGGGKSTTFELGTVYAGVNLTRRFVLVVAQTQQQADERVGAIRTAFERIGVGAALTKQGQSKGWRRDQLRTENGFNVAGIGLDVAVRGVKLDEFRPDWIHFDDIDNTEDTPRTVQKKLRLITQGILKAGVRGGTAVSFCQNLIHDNSIMARALGKLPGDDDGFLLDAQRIGPVNGFEGLRIEKEVQPDDTWRWRIREGRATWSGFGVEEAEKELNRDGRRAFLREVQNDVTESGGGLWDGYDFRYWFDDEKHEEAPELVRVAVAIDPSGSARGDEVGIVAAGKFRLPGGGGFGYVVTEDASDQLSPRGWAMAGNRVYREQSADKLLAESNFGGEMVEATLQSVAGCPPVTLVRVSRGKLIRAEPVLGLYEEGRVWHLKRFADLESEMQTWHPESGLPSPGRLDAAVIVLSELAGIADYVKPVPKAPASALPVVGGASRAAKNHGPRPGGSPFLGGRR